MYLNIDNIVSEVIRKLKCGLYLNESDEPKFKPTTEWMHEWYNKMNEMLFGGRLGGCRLIPHLTGKRSSKTLGRFSTPVNNLHYHTSDRKMYIDDGYGKIYINRSNFESLCKPTIELNSNYSATQDAWLNTLVHEMCHYYTYMDGFYHKQAHGVEFRNIASIVSRYSNGKITIQRLASAEEMQNFELDDEIKMKNQQRIRNKKSRMSALLVFKPDGNIRLITTSSEKVIAEVGDVHCTEDTIYFGYCNDIELINLLYSMGYDKSFRTYRYWSVENKPWLKDMPKYKWHRYFGSASTISQALNMEDKKQDDVETHQEQQEKQTDNEYLGYKIIKDGNGYNLINKFGNKTFGAPVDNIEFDNNNQEFIFKKGKFIYCGIPGKWKPYQQ